MNVSRSKDRERWHLERFKQACDDFPDGEIRDCEEPDFLLGNPASLGIELTQLFRPAESGKLPMQATEELQRRIHKEAQRIYEENGGPLLYVNVHFDSHVELSRKSVNYLASRLCDIVTSANPRLGDNLRLENPYTNLSKFPQEFISVSITYYAKATYGLWAPLNSAWVPSLTHDLLQQRINDKNKRISTYRKSSPNLWLVIVMDGGGLSSHMDIPDETLLHRFVSEFDKTYLFLNFNGNVICLNQE